MADSASPVEIPRPEKVRERLGECLREARLLRSLLRVSCRAEELRRQKSGEKEPRP